MIHLLFTGGTISMQRDERAGGNVPAHGGATLVSLAPELDQVSPYRIEDWGRFPACHLGLDRLWDLRNRVEAIASGRAADVPRPRGIVITHGTDTLEETAYLLSRTLDSEVPVAITGAMRTAGDAGWDGPGNLTDAARVAADAASRGRGAMVVFAGKVFNGTEAVKVHTVGLDAFAAPHGAAIGHVTAGRVQYTAAACATPPLHPRGLTARVALISLVVGDEGDLLELARPRYDGVVLAAFGSGNLPPGTLPAIRAWLEEGKPVVLASRCPNGEVTPAYAFEGGGATLVRMGVIPAGPRTPSQARMELTIALSAGAPYGGGVG